MVVVCDCYRAGHACLHRALACGVVQWCRQKVPGGGATSWWMVMMIDDTAVAVFISYSARILRARSGGTGDSVASLLLSQQEAAPNTQLSHAASLPRARYCACTKGARCRNQRCTRNLLPTFPERGVVQRHARQ